MHETRPGFFVHCGDTIYADIEIPAAQEEDTGELWHNVVTEEVSVGKRKVQGTETVSGDVRKEELKVEEKGDVKVRKEE